MKTQLLIAVSFSLFLIYPASAFSIDSVKISIDGTDSKSANIDFHYSLSWWEQIYYRYLATVSGGEKQLIESKFSEILDKKAEVKKLNTESNEVTLFISDFIAQKKDFKDGYWISYAGIVPKGEVFTIRDVRITYPDGYIKTYDGKIPSDVHFVNDKFTSYYYRSQYYQTLYDKSYGVYDSKNYELDTIRTKVGEEMLTKTGFYDFVINTGLKSIVVSSLPEKLQWIESLKGSIETITTGEPYKNLVNLKDKGLLDNVVKDSTLKGYMSSQGDLDGTHKKIADIMEKMSGLKTEEATLLEKLVSEPKEWNNNVDLLISNLNNQKTTLNELKEASNKMVLDVENWGMSYSGSEGVIPYLESISGLAKQISEEDLKNTNEKLEYLNKS